MRIERNDKTWLYDVEWDDGRKAKLQSVTTLIDLVFGTFRGSEVGIMDRLLETDDRNMEIAGERALALAVNLARSVRNAGNFGRHVHDMTELDDHGLLDEETLDPNLHGVLGAWRTWKSEYGIEIVESEAKIASRLGYAGTLDRIATSRIDDHGKLYLIEIKSRAFNPWRDPLQTAAYKHAWEEMTGQKLAKRFVVSLNLDGTYKVIENKGKRDMDMFRCALAIKQWRESNGKL